MPAFSFGYFDGFKTRSSESGAKEVACWGTGKPLREFLYVDGLADACVFLMNHYSGDETVNVGTGKELTIREWTELTAKVIGYEGKILWDEKKARRHAPEAPGRVQTEKTGLEI